MSITRRMILGGALASTAIPHAHAAAGLDDDGLYHFDWYLQSFLDLRDDIKTARAGGKHLAVVWGLKGCPYCKQMATVYMADPRVEAYIRDHFEVLHLNHIGALPVTGIDGAVLPEKAYATAAGIRYTPSIQFFSADGAPREVARMAGLPEPAQFLAMFRFVTEKAYATSSFPDWLAAQGAASRG